MAVSVIEPISRKHHGLPKDFRNQHPSLVQYLQRFALRHAQADMLARTFVAVDHDGSTARVAGYFTLATASVERASVSPMEGLERLPRFPIPAVLLARLAVDERVQGQGLGAYLLEEALGLTLQLARTGPVGFGVFITDAIDENAASFYARHGFHRLSEDLPCRTALDLEHLVTP